ncbi:5724_t:CDS:1, partial [Cetraspora pellucida]
KEEFDIMKKTLNLTIAMSRVEELYKIYKNFIGKIENKVVNQARNSNNIAKFVLTISNSISVKTKDQPKGLNNVNADIKRKKKQIPRHNQDNKENRIRKPQKILKDADLNVSKSSKIKEKKCSICNKRRHNACTCSKES